MSVEIHWDTLTSGPDGEQLAETVRAFIDEKFQQVTLPRFIRSVHVQSFEFGSIAPEVEIKDICDPLPDFYDDDDEDHEHDDRSSQNDNEQNRTADVPPLQQQSAVGINPRGTTMTTTPHLFATSRITEKVQRNASHNDTDTRLPLPKRPSHILDLPQTPLFAGLQTPGIPGGTSNLNYFHLPFGPGLSGTATPLAAVAGAHAGPHFHSAWPDNTQAARSAHLTGRGLGSVSSLTPPSTADPSSRPQSQHLSHLASDDDLAGVEGYSSTPASPEPRESNPNDVQVVAHVRYSGNLRLSLTAEILLDYPMPSFVGIPLQLNITGLRFDGIAILAYIKKRSHVCFLASEDAEAFVDQDAARSDGNSDDSSSQSGHHFGGLLEEIKVESEIGERDGGKQVLKNVGKVEKFILEQVRRIFEDEFVYPSFWTFLV